MTIQPTLVLCAAVTLAGCASPNPPLLFGDHASFGVHLANDNASGGATFAVGYRHLSVAVVPVSALTKDGTAAKIVAHDDRTRDDGTPDDVSDALSVFAVFEGAVNGTPPADSVARVGQVFSTGLAAQMLTQGYDCRARGDTECKRPETGSTVKPPQAARAADAGTAASETSVARGVSASAGDMDKSSTPDNVQTAKAPANDGPYQRPLVFMRNDVYGIDLEGSLAGQGGHFTLGYTSRNTALIPVVLRSAHGGVTKAQAEGIGTGWRDAFSVVGQFRADAPTGHAGLDLGRYFATGMAARNLGSSIQASVARSAAPQTKTAQPQPAQPAAGGAVQAAAQ